MPWGNIFKADGPNFTGKCSDAVALLRLEEDERELCGQSRVSKGEICSKNNQRWYGCFLGEEADYIRPLDFM